MLSTIESAVSKKDVGAAASGKERIGEGEREPEPASEAGTGRKVLS